MRALAVVVALLAFAPFASGYVALPPGDPRADLVLPVAAPVSTQNGDATAYPAWPILTAELQGLAADHRDILRLHSAGKSAKGFDLWYVEVADFENPDRVPIESREVLYIDGGTHANEYIGVIFVMHVLRWLVTGYGENETATWMVENRHTVILPLVNPEGSMNGVGRLNDNLVNINRNFPVGWGDIAETPVVNNPGPYPASEPETRAVIALWEKIQPDYVLSIHCCGNLWLYPYGIEGREPHADDKAVLERICDEVLFDVRESCGPTWSTIYPASGITSDAGYEITGANSWTFEMKGTGMDEDPAAAYPWPWGPPFYTQDIAVLQKESWRAVQHAFANVHRYGALPTLSVSAIDAGAVLLRVTNDGWGNLSGATITLTDASGQVRTAAVPALASGASTDVRLVGAFAEGEFDLAIAYAKRPLGGEGLLTHTLAVAASGAGLVGAIDTSSAGAGVTPPLATPGPALLGLAGALAAALALARRRWA